MFTVKRQIHWDMSQLNDTGLPGPTKSELVNHELLTAAKNNRWHLMCETIEKAVWPNILQWIYTWSDDDEKNGNVSTHIGLKLGCKNHSRHDWRHNRAYLDSEIAPNDRREDSIYRQTISGHFETSAGQRQLKRGSDHAWPLPCQLPTSQYKIDSD